jgi:hypothetical protein
VKRHPHYKLLEFVDAEFEVFILNEWRKTSYYDIACDIPGECQFRVKVTKPSINWEHVEYRFKWLATESNGLSYLYEMKPECRGTSWQNFSGVIGVEGFRSFTRGTCDWKDSLVGRP